MTPNATLDTLAPAPPKDPAQAAADAISELVVSDVPSRETGLRGEPTLHRPHEAGARPVLQQIIDQIQVRHGTVDVALSPEELGRVKLTLAVQDGALAVTIAAERGDTLDLIRRHADLLQQEAREAGYTSVSFSFSERPPGQGGSGPGTRNDDARIVNLPRSAVETALATRRATPVAGTLDIRL